MAVRQRHIVSPPIRLSASASPWIQQSRRIYVRPRTGPRSAHLWWPAVAKLQAASVPIARQLRHGTDRRTDRVIPKCPPYGGGIITNYGQVGDDGRGWVESDTSSPQARTRESCRVATPTCAGLRRCRRPRRASSQVMTLQWKPTTTAVNQYS